MGVNPVSSGRHSREPVTSVILAEGAPAQFHNGHTGAVQRVPGGFQRDAALQAAVRLSGRGWLSRQR